MSLRELARDRLCMVRLEGVCNGDPATTVLAHYRMAGICGAGQKPPDECGAWSCSRCHDEIDRRTRQLETQFVRAAHAEACLRTLHALTREGYSLRKGK